MDITCASSQNPLARRHAFGMLGGGLIAGLFMAGCGDGNDSNGSGGNSAQNLAIAQQIAQDEQAHIALIRTTITNLGGIPANKPAINLSPAASPVPFDGTYDNFLRLARTLSDVGISAYSGAAGPIAVADPTAGKQVAEASARILGAEGLHMGNIRLQIAQRGLSTTALDAADVLPPPSGTLYFTVDPTQRFTIARTPQQVAALAAPFFPDGLGVPIPGTTPSPNSSADTIAILNFALILEYLEGEFYTIASSGSGLPASLTGGAAVGPTTGGRQVNFSA